MPSATSNRHAADIPLLGYESEIFCESKRILPELRREARDLSEYQSMHNANDVALLHLSIGSA